MRVLPGRLCFLSCAAQSLRFISIATGGARGATLWCTGKARPRASVSQPPPHLRARALTRRVCGSTALQYPFVLAFEPTFVEIRNVETGAMSQIIQGNNLRCLFADTPPTSAHGPPPPPPPSQRASYAPYPPAGYGVQYGQQQQAYAQASYGARQSMQSVYGQQQQPGTPPYGPLAGAGGRQGRGEIIMVSDDRVMALRMASPG